MNCSASNGQPLKPSTLLEKMLKEETFCQFIGNSKIQKIEEALKSVEESYITSANEIKSIFDQLIDVVNKWKLSFLKEFEEAVKSQRSELMFERRRLTEDVATLKQLCFSSQIQMRHCDDNDFVKKDCVANQCLDELSPVVHHLVLDESDYVFEPIKFIPNGKVISELFRSTERDKLGYIQYLPLDIPRFTLHCQDKNYIGKTTAVTIRIPSDYKLDKVSEHISWKVTSNNEVLPTASSVDEDGSIKIEFLPFKMGVYTISCFVFNQHITGSPSTILPLSLQKTESRSKNSSSDSEPPFPIEDPQLFEDDRVQAVCGVNRSPTSRPPREEQTCYSLKADCRPEHAHKITVREELEEATKIMNGIGSSKIPLKKEVEVEPSSVSLTQTLVSSTPTGKLVDRTTKIALRQPLRKPALNVAKLISSKEVYQTKPGEKAKSKLDFSSSSAVSKVDINHSAENFKEMSLGSSSHHLNSAEDSSLKPGLKTLLLDKAVVKVSEMPRNVKLESNITLLDNNNNDPGRWSNSTNICPMGESTKWKISPLSGEESFDWKDYKGYTPKKTEMPEELKAEACDTSNTINFLQKKLIAKYDFVFSGTGHSRMKYPIGVTQLKNESIVVADTFNDRMLLLSSEGQFLREFNGNPPLVQPSAIVVLADGSFVVRDNHCLHKFSEACQYLFPIGSKILRKPFGLSKDENDHPVTIDTYLGEGMVVLRLDANSGKVVSQVVVKNAVPPSISRESKPRFIVCRPPSTVLIVDLGLNCIYIVNMETGKVLKKFGKKGKDNGEFNDPSGIVCDAGGFIMVGDSRNHRIQMFTPDGDFVSILQVDRPLNRPSGLALSPAGYLFVLNYWENSLVRYKLCVRN